MVMSNSHVTHVGAGLSVLEHVNLHKYFVQGVECMFLTHEMVSDLMSNTLVSTS